MQTTTDNEVISAILEGDIEEFEVIMKRYNEQFYRIAISFMKDPGETEDVMQSAYLKIFEHLSKFKQTSKFSTWAISILINECKMELRKKRHLIAFIQRTSQNLKQRMYQPTTESSLMSRELKSYIEQSILSLPAKYRTVFVMREINGCTVKETAENLQISESNVKVRLHRAKEQVRTKILREYSSHALFDYTAELCDPFRQQVMTLIRKEFI